MGSRPERRTPAAAAALFCEDFETFDPARYQAAPSGPTPSFAEHAVLPTPDGEGLSMRFRAREPLEPILEAPS